jgi:teichuronic acid exporter
MGSTVPKAMLRKELEYKTLVYYSTISMTIVSVGKLVAAWAGIGVYCLALPQALVSPFLMLALFLKTTWRPYGRLGVSHFRTIVNYSKHIIGGRVLTKLVNEGDNLIVGKLIGMEGLGIYALAFQLANLVTTNVVFLVNDIFLPLFSKVRGDIEHLKKLYLRMIRFLGFISFPLITALAISAESLIYFVYGERWVDAILPFQILCVFALGRSISSPSSALFSAVGKPDIGFKFAAYFAPVFMLSVLIGSKFGVVGVALATSLTRIGGSIISLRLSLNLIALSFQDLFKMLKSNLITTFLFFICLLLLISLKINLTYLLIGSPLIIYLHLILQRYLFPDIFIFFFKEKKKYFQLKALERFFQRIFFIG